MSELFNASQYLLDRQIERGNGDRLALTGVDGDLTYSELFERVGRVAAVLQDEGVQPEQRVLMLMADSPSFVAVYLAAMRLGAVPVPVSTMLHSGDVAELVQDSRARLLAVSAQFLPVALQATALLGEHCELSTILASGVAGEPDHDGQRVVLLDDRVAAVSPIERVYSTTPDSPAFWLYTSGTTGKAKGAMHRHGSIPEVCETYGTQVLGIRPDDRCLSAAKAFFAYGLGNSILFPMSVGAATILEPMPSVPALLAERASTYRASLFFAGPTFFANMLRADIAPEELSSVRLATSAGEALPAPLYERWTGRYEKEILDGLGMTEMLHIFLSNQVGRVKPGTTGLAVPGYRLRVVDEEGADVPQGVPGTLLVSGESTATGYWSRYEASRLVFQGEWLRTGDTYVVDEDGYFTCLGRSSDMLKASGIWVSPAEVEACLAAHDSVDQAVVVVANDSDGLEKPVAFVILHAGREVTEEKLIGFCREGLPSFKRPRKVLFVTAFPTTATGKVRRVELREIAASALLEPEQVL